MTGGPGFTVSIRTTSRAERVAAAEKGPRAVLAFDFPADLALPMGVERLVAAFNAVMGRTTVRPEIARAILPMFLLGEIEGDSRISDAAFLPLRHATIRFSWPDFDRWRATFVSAGSFPLQWADFADGLSDRRRAFRDQAAGLLAGTVRSTAWMAFRADQLRRTMQGPMAARRRLALFVTDPAAETFVRPFEAHLDLDDPATLPPYFPGDRTEVHIDRIPA